jgi:hypothetical protein
VHGSFKFEPAKGVPIPKFDEHGRKTGKFRPIVLAPVESRIVQRAILNVLVELETIKPYAETPLMDGMIDGWGKHYWFCNDIQTFRNIDIKINEKIRKFLGEYGEIKSNSLPSIAALLLGVGELAHQNRDPFSYPSVAKANLPNQPSILLSQSSSDARANTSL